MDNIKKGQTVYLKYERTENSALENLKDLYREGTISSIGRKYLTVDVNGYPYKFYKDTLDQVTNYAQDYYLYLSEKELLDELETNFILSELRSQIGIYSYSNCKLNINQLRRIKKIMDENNIVETENKDIDNSNLITQK
ncbi:TPA: hypothetical protein KOR49_002229 [Clostridioides difficile]|uniref:Uncharacterized protein n=2 Tax=Clostridioides difficile TaxID=1496 RepID=A0AAN5VRD4_CLODI|nr:hypothetical protein [Clostridioides difficile]CCL32266.1 hypothetical protein BN174_3880001 [Clostridioides difficile E15]EGT3944783.1 hypothetical protein [Clostridioides difficile]MBG0197900.1 hypothetical protein [Clostridioides difficile]MCA0574425.1 hypothetical protein [Clostridioides difficile]MDW0077019.1 hypothetical protein [Clostridioides difficile]